MWKYIRKEQVKKTKKKLMKKEIKNKVGQNNVRIEIWKTGSEELSSWYWFWNAWNVNIIFRKEKKVPMIFYQKNHINRCDENLAQTF